MNLQYARAFGVDRPWTGRTQPRLARRASDKPAFTLVELLLVVAIISTLAALLLPTLGAAKTKAQAIGCLNNTRQLTLAWHLYSTDYSDRVANNFGVNQTVEAIQNRRLDNWINNVMTWGASGGVEDASNTNLTWVTDGVLGRYTAGGIGVYKCPADTALSPSQLRARFRQRNRSVSMNSVFGLYNSLAQTSDPTAGGPNWGFPQYRQYLKQTQVPRPAKTWLFVDEHPDTINDGNFVNNPALDFWQDIPASYHAGACGFSFADGHSEIRSWRSGTSKYKGVLFEYDRPRTSFDKPGRADYAWYLERTGYVDAKTGEAAFNY